MKKKTKIILFVFLGLFVLLVLSSQNDFSMFMSSSNFSVYTFDVKKSGTVDSMKASRSFYLENPYALIFHGLRDEKIHTNYVLKDVVNVYVTQSNSLGLARFVPILKLIKYNSKISYHWTITKSNYTHNSILDSGLFEIRGKYNIIGICSVKKAEQLILNTIIEQAEKKIRDDIKMRLILKEKN